MTDARPPIGGLRTWRLAIAAAGIGLAIVWYDGLAPRHARGEIRTLSIVLQPALIALTALVIAYGPVAFMRPPWRRR